jgi:hypothetical protein
MHMLKRYIPLHMLQWHNKSLAGATLDFFPFSMATAAPT